MDPNSILLASLKEEEIRTHRETPQMCEHRGKITWGRSEKTAICEAQREASERIKPLTL